MKHHTMKFDGRDWVSDEAYKIAVRLAFVTGFSTARPVLEPPHQHTDEDAALMRRAFPFNFSLED